MQNALPPSAGEAVPAARHLFLVPTTGAQTVDPLLDLIQRYEAEERHFNSTPHASDEAANAAAARLDELFDELRDAPPAATTEAGALAALSLARRFLKDSCEGFEEALIEAAFDWFTNRAP